MIKLKYITFLGYLLLLSACSNAVRNDVVDNEAYPIDEIFNNFYQDLGGKKILGPTISPILREKESSFQYTVSSLMVYNHPTNSYKLAPLGRELCIEELEVQYEPERKETYIGTHYLLPAFEKIYKDIGGVEIVGNPLTEGRYNPIQRRYEQYFENLGFFQMEDDTSGQVFLLAYGAWKCGSSCPHTPPLNSRIDIPSKKAAPFVKFLSEVGSEFTGFALTEPYMASDGNLEQIFENVVLFVNPNHPDRVNLRPLPMMIGYQPDALELPLLDQNYFFYPIDGNMGFNIPVKFLEYIKSKGGFKISGPPITSISRSNDKLQQCFEAICLGESENLYKNIIINPSPLGYLYRDKVFVSEEMKPSDADLENHEMEISMSLWESYPMISSDRNQEIGVAVFHGELPLEDIRPILIIMLPEKGDMVYSMPPTNAQGESHIQVAPAHVSNGTLVPYQVCIEPAGANRFCIQDSYLVWDVVKIEQSDSRDKPSIIKWLQEQVDKLVNSE